MQVETEISKQRIRTLEEFEYLFEKTHERSGISCLVLIRQVHRACIRGVFLLGI